MTAPDLVAGVDSSTQSTKVVVCEADTGRVVREGRAPHPEGSEVDPRAWWEAYLQATSGGLLDGVRAIAVAGQQHGLVALDEDRRAVRKALLWNDTRSARAAADLVRELGGPQAWADAVGTVPLASITVSKLRWLAEHEPEVAARVHDVLLPHDWLTAHGHGRRRPDRRPARHRPRRRVGHRLLVAGGRGVPDGPAGARVRARRGGAGGSRSPRRGGPDAPGGCGWARAPATTWGPPSAWASGRATSSCRSAPAARCSASRRSRRPTPPGIVAGFADATGRFLPLVCTLNAARVLSATATLLSTDLAGLDRLALSAAPGAGGLTLLPYLDGERTPDLPDATGTLGGMTRDNLTPANLARAAVEGMFCGLADGLDALRDIGVPVRRVLLIGGRPARPRSAPSPRACWGPRWPCRPRGGPRWVHRRRRRLLRGGPRWVPAGGGGSSGEYVALGAARQAAWVLGGVPDAPAWTVPAVDVAPGAQAGESAYAPVRQAYRRLRESVHGV